MAFSFVLVVFGGKWGGEGDVVEWGVVCDALEREVE